MHRHLRQPDLSFFKRMAVLFSLALISIEVSAVEYMLPCYNMTQTIPCGQSEFPRQAGDYFKVQAQNRFKLSDASQVVFDQQNNLRWMRCSLGAKYQQMRCVGAIAVAWDAAQHACKNLSLGHQRWRLPSVMELNSLLQLNQAGVKIEQHFFPDTELAAYWTAAQSLTAPLQTKSANNAAWHINFANGAIFDAQKQTAQYVRCVSDITP